MIEEKMQDDLISRQQAIDAVKIGAFSAATIYGRTDEGSTALHETVRAIKALPPAEPKWISCSKRLPEDNRQVLVYARSVHYALAKYDEMREADGTYKKQWVTFDAWKPFYKIKEVIAWMPLPTYEGVKE